MANGMSIGMEGFLCLQVSFKLRMEMELRMP